MHAGPIVRQEIGKLLKLNKPATSALIIYNDKRVMGRRVKVCSVQLDEKGRNELRRRVANCLSIDLDDVQVNSHSRTVRAWMPSNSTNMPLTKRIHHVAVHINE